MARPPRISREAMLDAAVAIVRAEGVEGLTMRNLARALAVDPMALYRHVGDKEELLDAIVERLLSAIPVPPRRLSWQRRVQGVVAALVGFARQHPSLMPLLAARGYGSGSGWAIVECVLGACEDAGLGRKEAAAAASLLLHFALGLCVAQSSSGGRWDDAPEVAAFVDGLEPSRFPSSRRLAPTLLALESDHLGRAPLRLLTDALAMLAPRRAK